MRAAVVVVGLLGACGGHSAPGTLNNTSDLDTGVDPGLKTPVQAFPALAKADFVVLLATKELAAYSLVNDQPLLLGTLPMAFAEPEEWGGAWLVWWIDRDHLILRGGNDRDLWVVTTAGAQPLVTPPDDRFASIPKPPDPNGYGLEPGSDGQPVRGAGTLYWNHCAWGFPADGFQCEADGNIRIYPSDASQQLVASVPTGGQPWLFHWTDGTPGFPLEVVDEHAPTCTAKGQPVTLPAPGPESQSGPRVWFPGAPNTVLVEYGDFGMSDFVPSSFSVFTGCSATPMFSGSSYELFSNGLWVAEDEVPGTRTDESSGTHVTRLRRNLTVLLEVPPNVGLAVRPAP